MPFWRRHVSIITLNFLSVQQRYIRKKSKKFRQSSTVKFKKKTLTIIFDTHSKLVKILLNNLPTILTGLFWLTNGYKIKVFCSGYNTVSVPTQHSNSNRQARFIEELRKCSLNNLATIFLSSSWLTNGKH